MGVNKLGAICNSLIETGQRRFQLALPLVKNTLIKMCVSVFWRMGQCLLITRHGFVGTILVLHQIAQIDPSFCKSRSYLHRLAQTTLGFIKKLLLHIERSEVAKCAAIQWIQLQDLTQYAFGSGQVALGLQYSSKTGLGRGEAGVNCNCLQVRLLRFGPTFHALPRQS